jgi:signal transduction histidine kinase
MTRTTEKALRERIKELSCLYSIAQIASQPDKSEHAMFEEIVALIPRAWQYPDIAYARITADGRAYGTPGFREGGHRQIAPIVVGGRPRGTIEVAYGEERPELDEGPFLQEERNLIEAIAGQVAMILARRDAEVDRANLENQLRHADRLATIGQLAAGVAHELNEPLGNILGCAQLAAKCPGLPPSAKGDLDNIEMASLRARDIIRRLLVFARQVPPQSTRLDLNRVVENGLHFFETRCAKDGIEVVQSLSPGLPELLGDPGQLTQVLVNLVVNAIQAMPHGGRLTIATGVCEGFVRLVVEDTGTGMSPEVVEKLFVPFFTTKDVGEGTGLGLPVAHGIVESHGGSIRIDSAVGKGTRIEIAFPITVAERPRPDAALPFPADHSGDDARDNSH